MKKLLILALALCSFSAHASKKDYGVYGGLNFTSVSMGGTVTTGRSGLILGAHAFFPLKQEFEFVPSLQLAQRGAKRKNYSNQVGDISWRATYLEALPLIRMNLPIQSMDAYVTAGPNIGLKVSTGCEFSVLNTPCLTQDDAINAVLIGFELGVGADFTLANKNEIGVEARYHFGFTDFFDLPDSGSNRGLALLFHFNF